MLSVGVGFNSGGFVTHSKRSHGKFSKISGNDFDCKVNTFCKTYNFFLIKHFNFQMIWIRVFPPKEQENVNSYCAILNKFGGEQPKVNVEILHC